jgi:hypothetical protein
MKSIHFILIIIAAVAVVLIGLCYVFDLHATAYLLTLIVAFCIGLLFVVPWSKDK